ncbi:MAG: 50S ribosome-binding GTPase [Fimbriimonadales bacterium]|jgi:ferrous iron transport protein B|nr:50S ribosome-binding GTPase [Fimbriimonadales bacterium]CUU04659.1 ferrous iron transport protein B [Armatimonadetes bacterium GBS]CUU36298.1 ferrous iron transport protein B [Armatimonadetes bacterium DC]CUU38153.1 ferrous iron transport protein B [Armatimonadetes bacterium GXS]GBC90192.1 Fe(2+) transporter FeoB [bacterium HR14]
MSRAPRRQGAHTPTVLIVGNPNVGKSVLFHRLTGRYVTVSNYPGTTVEIERGTMRHKGHRYTVVDAPGLYSLMPITEEERVARRMLFHEPPDLVLHVVDAKNLSRSLSLTLQLVEAGLEVVLVLNMMDELERAGLQIDTERLAQQLGIPVVPTVCVSGEGIEALKELIHERLSAPTYLSARD